MKLSIGGMIFELGGGRGGTKYSEKNILHDHFIHHKLRIDKSGIETGITLWGARRTKRANIKLIFTVCFSASSENYVYIYTYICIIDAKKSNFKDVEIEAAVVN
jgi:hypothetical protein